MSKIHHSFRKTNNPIGLDGKSDGELTDYFIKEKRASQVLEKFKDEIINNKPFELKFISDGIEWTALCPEVVTTPEGKKSVLCLKLTATPIGGASDPKASYGTDYQQY